MTRHPRPSSRGFVLPVVILLVVMVGAVCSIMLERHVARMKTVQRQLDAYQEHHGVRSLQAVVGAWRKSPTAQPRTIEDMLENDGLAFTVDPGDNTRISVYLFRGQGTMLRRVGGIPGDDRERAMRVVERLYNEVKDVEQRALLVRDAGPLAVDVNTADPVVLRAVVRGVLGDGPEARAYEGRLIDARMGGQEIRLQTLSNFATESGLDADQRTMVNRFLTVSPEVWRFRIDVRGTGVAAGMGLVSRYGGLIHLGSSSVSATNTFEEPTPFLSWERLNPGDPYAVE